MSLKETLFALRREYSAGSFNEDTANPNPVEQFRDWFNDAVKVEMLEPNAFVLSTVSADSRPSSRVLLLKQYDDRGFVFFTNYQSRKGMEMELNPNASMLFYWDKLERQVRIEGKIEKVTFEESDAYFQTRPYESRLGAWASRQSQALASRFALMRQVAVLMAKYPKYVPLPDFWGGYRLVPDYYEFWQGRPSRLHDRVRYTPEKGEWKRERLYP